jgi:predicted nucleotide-binding protein
MAVNRSGQPAGRTRLVSPRPQVEDRIKERLSLGRELLENLKNSFSEENIIAMSKWREFNLALLESYFSDKSIRDQYGRSALDSYIDMSGDFLYLDSPKVLGSVIQQLVKLESILETLEFYDLAQANSPAPTAPIGRLEKIFVVHGHDEAAREAVARFIQSLGFEPIILSERANEGRTVIEKFEAHSDVGFAVVLLTPDDEGCEKGGAPGPRARQNVVLELGYFIGRLGRKHVCALKRGELEIPSDFHGVVYEPFDASGSWKQKLGRELEAAGYNIDWNKIMRA